MAPARLDSSVLWASSAFIRWVSPSLLHPVASHVSMKRWALYVWDLACSLTALLIKAGLGVPPLLCIGQFDHLGVGLAEPFGEASLPLNRLER